MLEYKNYIGGRFVDGTGAFAAIDPATGQPAAWVHEADVRLADRAVDEAHDIFDRAWGRIDSVERCGILYAVAAAIEDHSDALVAAEVTDTGQPSSHVAEFDIVHAAAQFRACADALATAISHVTPGRRPATYQIRKPLGVVGVFPSWRLPLLSLASGLAPVLAAGNTAVVKPAVDTPGTATLLAGIATEAGLPAGVYNVVHGFDTGAASERLSKHHRVRSILQEEGRRLRHRSASGTPERVTCVAIVCADADIAAAAGSIARSIAFKSGQSDASVDRVYIDRSVYDEMCSRLTEILDSQHAGADFGPLISRPHYEAVVHAFDRAAASGSKRITEHDPTDVPRDLRDGFWIRPTLWAADDLPRARAFQRIDGPTAILVPFDDERELNRRAFCGEGRLWTSIWTRAPERGHDLARTIDADTVWVDSWFVDHPYLAEPPGKTHDMYDAGDPATRMNSHTHLTRIFSLPPD
ncbi:hypothetical protein Z045_10170 [Rhodococcus pyridinivorans KG-16]|uniref:Aldehyde dehydrogenase domain-containing protein n=1 Tax=Rhodococcus pyridinivorans KG-16 TaxID=1441730 RepID=A0A0V9ULT9_9NOCA|nr:hypothetical protein Z045_10170 [Rhodococcus pyridinivorans KG-16]